MSVHHLDASAPHSPALRGAVCRRLALCLALGLALVPDVALRAQEEASAEEPKGQRAPPETRKANAMRQTAGKALVEAQTFLSDDKIKEALAVLSKVDTSKFNDYEKAVTNQLFAYAYLAQEDYKRAIEFSEKALEAGVLNPGTELNMLFNVAQLYRATDQLGQSIATFEKWLERAEEPSGSQLFQIASTYAQMERFNKSSDFAERAVASTPEPEESWLTLLASVYLNQRQYRKAINPLERLVLRFPKLTYYKQIAVAYSESKQEKKALVALELAHKQGLITDGRDLRRLAEQYMYHDMPYKAANLLAKEIEAGRVEKTEDNWFLLATAWFQARETEKAIAPMQRAAELASTGENYMRLGKILIDLERWNDAEARFKNALDKGKIEQGEVHLNLGIALVGQKKTRAARDQFQACLKFSEWRNQCNQWITYVNEKERDAAREASAE
jgi:tetratricopeptide (TPR) repeat protein